MARTVLLVEDDADVRRLVRGIVSDRCSGWSLAEAANGPEAIDAWRAARPDVVVLDHRMPGMTGLDIAERILAEDPNQVVILVSAYLSAGVETRAEALGVCAVLGKDEYGRLPEVLEACAPQPRKSCVTQ